MKADGTIPEKPIKAIVYRSYGPPHVLKLEDVEKPTVSGDRVLINVRAASVNPIDWHFMRGRPYAMRIMTGLRRPNVARLGVDVAGQVEAVGGNVTQFKPGDEVFGSCRGAFAEYACAPERTLAAKPSCLTFEQAASIPVAALTALQGLRDKGKVQAGQRVLINGASGGVGTFAVQIAKAFGADVTAVCSARNADMVRSIGADRVIDYTREDFARAGQRYDVMFDSIGNRSLSACRHVLNPKGAYVVVGGPDFRWIGPLANWIKVRVLSRFVSQSLAMFLARINKGDLEFVCDLMKAGRVAAVIDRSYRLTDVPDAIRYLEEGHARGKVVVTVGGSDRA